MSAITIEQLLVALDESTDLMNQAHAEITRLRAENRRLERELTRVRGLIAAQRLDDLEPLCTCNASAANRAIGNHFGDCPLR